MTRNIGDQREVDKDRKSLKVERARLKERLRWLMGDERGRTYLADLVRDSHAFATSEVSTTHDALLLREGMRVMGLRIANDVREHCPEHFPALLSLTMRNPLEGAKDVGTADDE
jgi:hypothetical protein